MSKNDVAKDFQDSYESSNNGDCWGPYFYGARFNRVKKNKKDDMNTWNLPGVGVMAYSTSVSLAPNYPQACTVPCDMAECKSAQKKEKTMYVDNDKHLESSKINYLNDRLQSVYYKKTNELKKSFGMVNDTAPETAVDLIKRIQDGKYVLSDESKNKPSYEAARYITWRDPSVKEDKAGFDAAMTQFKVVYQDAQDAIAIQTPAEALAAIKALDAWTPSK